MLGGGFIIRDFHRQSSSQTFFSEQKLRRTEARWMETMGKYGSYQSLSSMVKLVSLEMNYRSASCGK